MHAISSYRGNRHRQPACLPQTGPITIHCAAMLSAQCKTRLRDRTDRAWFNRLLHPTRKRSGSILTTPEPARGDHHQNLIICCQSHSPPVQKCLQNSLSSFSDILLTDKPTKVARVNLISGGANKI